MRPRHARPVPLGPYLRPLARRIDAEDRLHLVEWADALCNPRLVARPPIRVPLPADGRHEHVARVPVPPEVAHALLGLVRGGRQAGVGVALDKARGRLAEPLAQALVPLLLVGIGDAEYARLELGCGRGRAGLGKRAALVGRGELAHRGQQGAEHLVQARRGGVARHRGRLGLAQLVGVVVLPDGAPVVVGQAVGRGARVHPVRKVLQHDLDPPGRVGPHVDVAAAVVGGVDVPAAHPAPAPAGRLGRRAVALAALAASVVDGHLAHALVDLAVVAQRVHLLAYRVGRLGQQVVGRLHRADASRPARLDPEDMRRDLGDRRGAAVGPDMDVPESGEHPRGKPRVPYRPPARCADLGAAAVAAHVVEDDVLARDDDPLELGDLLCGRAGLGQVSAAAVGALGWNAVLVGPVRLELVRHARVAHAPARRPPRRMPGMPRLDGPPPAVLGGPRAAPRRGVGVVVVPVACGQLFVVVSHGLAVGLEPPDLLVALGDLGGVLGPYPADLVCVLGAHRLYQGLQRLDRPAALGHPCIPLGYRCAE